MPDHPITIDVKRSDGHVTRLQGTAGLSAVCRAPRDVREFTPETETPIVSLRADTRFQLAVLLGAIISAAEEVDPGVTGRALELTTVMDSDRPETRHVLPERGRGS